MTTLSGEEALRYSRHIKLPDFGTAGQQKLKTARVLIIGVGGLGSPAALYLAAAGVGTIGLMDGDNISLSNLQRQVLHSTPDLGRSKVESAREKLLALNPNIEIVCINDFLTADNAALTIQEYDFIIDGTDDIEAKFLINDTCVALGKPFSYAALLRYEAQAFTYAPGHADLRAIFGAPPAAGNVETCALAGVLGSVAGMFGTIQATEAVKYLADIGQPLIDRLLIFNALDFSSQLLDIS